MATDYKWDELLTEHPIFTKNKDDYRFYLDAFEGGRAWQDGKYLRVYASDNGNTQYLPQSNQREGDKSFNSYAPTTDTSKSITDQSTTYGEKLKFVPALGRCRLYINEYTSLAWETPPTRTIEALQGETRIRAQAVINDADQSNMNINMFMRSVDQNSHAVGFAWVASVRFQGMAYSNFAHLNPLYVKNWKRALNPDGTRPLSEVVEWYNVDKVMNGNTPEYYGTVRVFNALTIDHITRYKDKSEIPEQYRLQGLNDKIGQITRINETTFVFEMPHATGRVPIEFCPNIRKGITEGISSINNLSMQQRFVYNMYAEIWTTTGFDIHEILEIDEDTLAMNGGRAPAEAGAVAVTPATTVDAQGNKTEHGINFKGPQLRHFPELRATIKDVLMQMDNEAMVTVGEMMNAANSGEQLRELNESLKAMIRGKQNNLENCERNLWELWLADQGIDEVPEGFEISYNKNIGRNGMASALNNFNMITNAMMNGREAFGEEFGGDMQADMANELQRIQSAMSTDGGVNE